MQRFEYPGLDEAVWREKLENGLTVAVVPREGFSKRMAYFVTDYGSMHTHFSFEGRQYITPAGVAHFLEHKMFDMPDGRDVSAEFAALGAFVNAFTSYDLTAYHFSCTENFYPCLRLLLEFVSTPCFSEESVQKELGIIDQEISMNEDSPDSMIYDNLMAAAYSAHPVRVPILGSTRSIREITPEILYTCHRAFYNPENMLLCVVGDVDPQEVRRIALEVLGKESREAGQKLCHWAEPDSCPTAFVSRNMEVAMPMFQLLFKSPVMEKGDAGIRRELVADLAAEALFGESSRLYLRLYEEGLIDSSFGGGFESFDGTAMLLASGDSRDPEAVREAILDRARELLEEGIPEEDFLRIRRSTLGRRIRALDSFDSVCFRLCAYHMSGFDYFRFPELYRQITCQELTDFIRDIIRRENCCLSVIYPQEVSQ